VSVYVRVRVGSEMYALPVEHVLEVAELGDVTPMPGAPPEVLGLRKLRGQIVPVIDLGFVFGIGRTEEPRRLVVAETEGRRAGFAIAEVHDVGDLSQAFEETDSKLLAGSALVDDQLVGVVDIPRLFATLERAIT
jgi:purine-binding chemotaxis protein CheW